jgi:hypothetical protein
MYELSSRKTVPFGIVAGLYVWKMLPFDEMVGDGPWPRNVPPEVYQAMEKMVPGVRPENSTETLGALVEFTPTSM